MIHIGFTGTRHGMTPQQRAAVRLLVIELARKDMITAHHGDCVGADAEFHEIAWREGARIVMHPPADASHRAWVVGASEWRPTLTHLARNRAIVSEAGYMIGAPFEMVRQPRGGTWYTIDHARRVERALAIAYPDGTIVREGMWTFTA